MQQVTSAERRRVRLHVGDGRSDGRDGGSGRNGSSGRDGSRPGGSRNGDGRDGRPAGAPVEVSYRVAGEGSPVVLLHGVGLDAADVSWRYALPMLANGHRVYAPDLPGHGDSDKPDVRYTTAYYREVLEAFLDELDLNEAALVGISMGGAIALGHAMEYPVDDLVLVDAYGLGRDAHWRKPAWLMLNVPFAHRQWWRLVGASEATVRSHLGTICGDGVPEDLVRDVYGAVQGAAVGETVASWQRSEFRATGLHTDYSDRLAGLRAETLLVHGERDPLVPLEWSRDAAAAAPNARVETFATAGHWPPREQPERFNRLVRAFLA